MSTFPERPEPAIPVAVSECLLGVPVRYDGAHKRSSLCHDQLEGLFDWRGICPEVAIGLGTPREPMRLVRVDGEIRVRGIKSPDQDFTDPLRQFGQRVAPTLNDVAGYVFMKGSPSCGMERVKVYPERGGAPHSDGIGAFAKTILENCPTLPVEESGRLNDPALRENFVARTFLRAHWLRLRTDALTRANLLEFHARYKYLLMAHSVETYREIGPQLADLSRAPLEQIADEYFEKLMRGMARIATRGTHANVLNHLQGYLKRDLEASSRQELATVIDAYRTGEVPLIVPVTLLKHLLGRFPDDYALKQIYLDPHPAAKGLRNAI